VLFITGFSLLEISAPSNLEGQSAWHYRSYGNTTITNHANDTGILSSHQNNTASNSNSSAIANKNNNINSGTGTSSAKLNQSTSTSSYSYSSSSSSSYTSPNNTNSSKKLSVLIHSSQNIVNGKGRSNITATALDAATGSKLDIATVKLKITFGSNGTNKEIIGHNGEVSYSSGINPNPRHESNSHYNATVEASAPGYISTTKTSTLSSTSVTRSNSSYP
jgi:hypothetical protein